MLSAGSSINVDILFLSFKCATTLPIKLIDNQHYKRHRWKIPITFHSLSHFILTTTQLNLTLKNLLITSKRFRDCYCLFATSTYFIQTRQKHGQLFESEVRFKPMTNRELSNALVHDVKLVLSFIMSGCKSMACVFLHMTEILEGVFCRRYRLEYVDLSPPDKHRTFKSSHSSL